MCCIHVCGAFMRVHMYVQILACVETRSRYSVSFSVALDLMFLRWGSFTGVQVLAGLPG